MPGFLSEYDETETLKFGDDEQWWVTVRKHLLRGEYGEAQTALVQPIMKYVGKVAETQGDVDTVSYQDVLVYHAVVSWNLTDREGELLPLAGETVLPTGLKVDAKRHSISLLPEEVFDAIVAVVKTGEGKKDDKDGEASEKKDDPFRGRRAVRAHGNGAATAGA